MNDITPAEMVKFLAVEAMGWSRVVIRRGEVQYLLRVRGTGWQIFDPLADGNHMLALIEAVWERFKIRICIARENDGIFSALAVSKTILEQCYDHDIKTAVCKAAYKALKAAEEKA